MPFLPLFTIFLVFFFFSSEVLAAKPQPAKKQKNSPKLLIELKGMDNNAN